MSSITDQTQAEVIRFLLSGKAFEPKGPVAHIETHCAHVFLCGEAALKLKRAVRYDYLDQSTPERRHDLLQREVELNRAGAPMIYRDVVAVTRAADGGLELGGAGEPVDWVLRMHRFAAACEMTGVAASGRLTDAVAEALGQAVQRFHAGCPLRHEPGDDLIREIIDELARVLLPLAEQVGEGVVDGFLARARRQLTDLAGMLRERAAQGHLKRVHGDLHLRNLLLIDGQPVLFDALEFDERLGTCDVLYDLAFLLMDLCHRGLTRQANVAMAAYLLAAAGAEDAGLAALPLFMAVRAAIRAMVLLQTDEATGRTGVSAPEARRYLEQATRHLEASRPVLIAVGGLSGSGKTVLARELAAGTGICPGAVHLRTDTERKAGAEDFAPGARAVDYAPGARAADYAPGARAVVYYRMLERAGVILRAGRSVILDGTFLDPVQRAAAHVLAAGCGTGFCGLWLTAPQAVLIERVSRRRDDASDADAAVVRAQASAGAQVPGPGWVSIDASGTPETTRAAACAALASVLGTLGGTETGSRLL